MKNYRILKSFKGSQTGHDCHEFEAGTEVPLSDSLAEVVVKEGWAELIVPTPAPEPAPIPEPEPVPEAEAVAEPVAEDVPAADDLPASADDETKLVEPETVDSGPEAEAEAEEVSEEETVTDAEDRETKVEAPQETKPDTRKKSKK